MKFSPAQLITISASVSTALGQISVVTQSINTAECSAKSSDLLPSGPLPPAGGNATGVSSSPTGPSGSPIGSGSSPSGTPDLVAPFLISFSPSARQPDQRRRRKERRQTSSQGGYIQLDGGTAQDCKSSTSYSVIDQKLYATTGSGIRSVYSVPAELDFAPFLPSDTETGISVAWVFEEDQLRWKNVDFDGGYAEFCLDNDGVTVYYGIPPPADCSRIDFGVQPVTECPGYAGDVNATSPSSPSGVSVPPTPQLTPSGPDTGSSIPPIPNQSGSTPQPVATPTTTTPGGNSSQPSAPFPVGNSTSLPQPSGSGISTPPIVDPECAPEVDGWELFYYNKGFTLDKQSPALDPLTPPLSTTFDGVFEACEAYDASVSYILAGNYSTFEVYYDNAAKQWVTNAYAGSSSDPTLFSVANSNAARVYGYFRTAPTDGTDITISDPECPELALSDFKYFYSGSGYFIPIEGRDDVQTVDDITGATDCEAIAKCEALASNGSTFSTFQLLEIEGSNGYTCDLFTETITDPVEVSEEDSTILKAFAYSRDAVSPEPSANPSPASPSDSAPSSGPSDTPGNGTVTDPDCTGNGDWTNFFAGTGRTIGVGSTAIEHPDLANTLTACEAVAECRVLAESKNHHTFDVHQEVTGTTVDTWACISYSGAPSDDPETFETNTGVGEAYGYSLKLPCNGDPPRALWEQYFQGYNYVAIDKLIHPANIDEANNPVVATSLSSTTYATDCAALTQCFTILGNSHPTYKSLSLTKDPTPGATEWICTLYFGDAGFVSNFKENERGGNAYGYFLST